MGCLYIISWLTHAYLNIEKGIQVYKMHSKTNLEEKKCWFEFKLGWLQQFKCKKLQDNLGCLGLFVIQNTSKLAQPVFTKLGFNWIKL